VPVNIDKVNDMLVLVKPEGESWYSQKNDLIGGWCVRTVDSPPSKCRAKEIADLVQNEDISRFIARCPTLIRELLLEIECLREQRGARDEVISSLSTELVEAVDDPYTDMPAYIRNKLNTSLRRAFSLYHTEKLLNG